MTKFIFKTAFSFFLLLVLLAAIAFYFPQELLILDSGTARADVIVLLGGGAYEERPLRAAELFHEHAAPAIIVTGVGDDEINRRLLLQEGVPPAAIQVEGKSTTTEENAEFTTKLMHAEKFHSAILVTSWYHSRRSLRTFEHCAPDLKFYSRPTYFAMTRNNWTRNITRHIYLEYVKLPGYWLRYGVCPF